MEEEQQLLHQQLLGLGQEAAAIDTRIEAAAGNMKAALAKGDDAGTAMHTKVYDNLVACQKDLNTMRVALAMQGLCLLLLLLL